MNSHEILLGIFYYLLPLSFLPVIPLAINEIKGNRK